MRGQPARDTCKSLLFSVGKYIERYVDMIDDQRFSATLLAGNVRDICDVRIGSMHDTVLDAWI